VPYTFAVALFGGRNWTIISAALLLIPTVAAFAVMKPGTSFNTFLLVGLLAGIGGGNFASSMTNINAFFPLKKKGWALGLNAGGGNIGVPVIQLVALAIIGAGGGPRVLLGIYIPLILLAAVLAAVFMDNLATVKNDTGAAIDAAKDAHTWIMSFLYVGTFGSFIGFAFAFGQVRRGADHALELRRHGRRHRPPRRRQHAEVTAAVRHVLRRAVRAQRPRQRVDVQDDPRHLPDQGPRQGARR
jgi:NNP family nitrate/nitrite transporter-like MFS transporter